MYFDKRNKDGLILSFDAFKTGKEISDFSFERFVKSKVYKIFGDKGLIFDKYLKTNLSKEKKISWIQDQYNHPVESLHSIGEVLDWFRKKNFSFVSSIPKIQGNFSLNEKIFVSQNKGDVIDRFNTQFEMIFNYQSKEGGLFTMIGKKK